MPFMNGINLLEHIRMEKLKTRVLFLTGYEYFEYAHKAVQLQAFDFLLKPITTEKLLSAVERAASILKRRRQQRKLWEKARSFPAAILLIGCCMEK